MIVPIYNKIKYKKSDILSLPIQKGVGINCKVGEDVYYKDVILQIRSSFDSYKINLFEKLGKDFNAKKHLKVMQGEIVKKGDLLAEKPKGMLGIMYDEVKSPVDGALDLSQIDEGLVNIESTSASYIEIDGVNGRVKKIVPDSYLELEADVMDIHPQVVIGDEVVFGNLEIIKANEGERPSKLLSMSHEGHIILLNEKASIEFLRKAETVGVRGVVCAGIDIDQYEDETGDVDIYNFCEHFSLKLCILEGFGQEKMYSKLYKELQLNDGMLVVIDERLRIVIRGMAKPRKDTVLFKTPRVGNAVIVYSDNAWGKYGRITRISDSSIAVTLEDGNRIDKVNILNIMLI